MNTKCTNQMTIWPMIICKCNPGLECANSFEPSSKTEIKSCGFGFLISLCATLTHQNHGEYKEFRMWTTVSYQYVKVQTISYSLWEEMNMPWKSMGRESIEGHMEGTGKRDAWRWFTKAYPNGEDALSLARIQVFTVLARPRLWISHQGQMVAQKWILSFEVSIRTNCHCWWLASGC